MYYFTIILTIVLLSRAHAHSFLSYPGAYNRKFQLRNCEGEECSQACPNVLPDEDMRNTPDTPAAVWKRGEKVTITWARNNHEHGFVRFTLVPISHIMDREWHRRLAFFYGCFSQGKFPCSYDDCGSDRGNVGYSRKIVIPDIFPDGMYVFGLVWYGGVRTKTGNFFSDYWSCSFVEINGGNPVGGSYTPYFDVGDNEDAIAHEHQCLTAIDEPGKCPNTGCTGPGKYGVPKPFDEGRSPKPMTVSSIIPALM